MTSLLDDSITGQRNEKRVEVAAATGLVAAASGAGAGVVMADMVTVTTTQQYGPTPLSYDVLFTPVENATDLVSISAGSVYTGEGPSFSIEAIASDDTTVSLFYDPFYPFFFETQSLSSITNNTFAEFSAREIKGLRFTLDQPNPGPQPSLTLPVGTEFVFSTVPEPAAAVLLGCSLAAILIGRRFGKLRSAASSR